MGLGKPLATRDNDSMRIDVKDPNRQWLFTVDVDLSDPPGIVRPPQKERPEIHLDWDQAIDDTRHLRRCPVCGCRELFARKDFHQMTGLLIVAIAGFVAMALFGTRHIKWGLIVLGLVVLIDAIVYLFVRRLLVCYQCRSEFRKLQIRPDHPCWDLSIGEKYRHAGT